MTNEKLKHPAAERNAQAVIDWVKATPLDSVPVNQFNQVNITKILKELDISRSSAESNPKISKAFEDLNKRVAAKAPPKSSKGEIALTELQGKQREIQRLQRTVHRFQSLFNDGVLVE